jgi:streptomycin 6-kinase
VSPPWQLLPYRPRTPDFSYISTAWSKLGRPCSERVVELALRFAEAGRDAFDPAVSVPAHGDAHAWNTLLDPATNRYKLVDPDGWFIERAHDLSLLPREWRAELLAGDPVALASKRCSLLSRPTGVPENAIGQWAFIERLANGLRETETNPRDVVIASAAKQSRRARFGDMGIATAPDGASR